MTQSAPQMIDPLELLAPLRRGRSLLWAGALLGALAAGIYAFLLASPRFEASALVMIEPREASVTGLAQVLGGLGTVTSANAPILRTELEVLRSRSLIGQVVDRMDLVTIPEFNPRLGPPGLRESLNRLTAPEMPPLEGEALARADREATISRVQSKIAVEALPNSLVFRLTARSSTPERAAALANGLAEGYIAEQLHLRREASERAVSYLQGQLQRLRTDLDAARRRFHSFQAQTPLSDLEGLATLERRLKDVRLSLVQAEAELERAKSVSERSAIEARVKGLRSALEALAQTFSQQSEDQMQRSDLQSEVEANAALHEHVQNRLKETIAQADVQQADSRILSAAVAPQAAAAPRRKLLVAMGGVAGFGLAAIFLILRDIFGTHIRSAREAEAISGLRVLAEVPRHPKQNPDLRRLSRILANKRIIAVTSPSSEGRLGRLASGLAKLGLRVAVMAMPEGARQHGVTYLDRPQGPFDLGTVTLPADMDLLLIDLTSAPETFNLPHEIDGCLLWIDSHRTTKDDLREAIEAISDGPPVLGLILGNAEVKERRSLRLTAPTLRSA